jgi:hypothetical protein
MASLFIVTTVRTLDLTHYGNYSVRNNAVLCPQEKPVKIERFVTTANPAQ